MDILCLFLSLVFLRIEIAKTSLHHQKKLTDDDRIDRESVGQPFLFLSFHNCHVSLTTQIMVYLDFHCAPCADYL